MWVDYRLGSIYNQQADRYEFVLSVLLRKDPYEIIDGFKVYNKPSVSETEFYTFMCTTQLLDDIIDKSDNVKNDVLDYVLKGFKPFTDQYTNLEESIRQDAHSNSKNKRAWQTRSSLNIYKIKNPPVYSTSIDSPSALAGYLPAIKVRVRHPIHGILLPLREVIISLNDSHKWTRDQIADWLETLDVDLRFSTGQEKESVV